MTYRGQEEQSIGPSSGVFTIIFLTMVCKGAVRTPPLSSPARNGGTETAGNT